MKVKTNVKAGWLPIAAAVVGGLLSARQAKKQNEAARAAAQPQPYDRHEVRAPWEPTRGLLEEALGWNRDLYLQNRDAPGPPQISTAGITGASPRLRELAQMMSDRALNSTFVPDMQSRLTDFMSGPNEMMQGAYDRAMNYQNPMMNMLTQQGLGGIGSFDSGSGQIQGLISNLMGGQTQLGSPPPGPVAAPGPPLQGPPAPPGPMMAAGPGLQAPAPQPQPQPQPRRF